MWLGRWTSYATAFSLVTLVLVYVLDVPTVLSGAPDLVREYYYGSAPLLVLAADAVLVAGYVALAMVVAGLLRVPATDHAAQLLVVAATTVAVSGTFLAVVPNVAPPSAFFARWFARVGWRALACASSSSKEAKCCARLDTCEPTLDMTE